MAQSTYPLAWGRDGEPIDVPKEAVGWKVRHSSSSGRGGAGAVVYHDAIPLQCALETTADELRALTNDRPGKYRLDAVDEAGRSVGAEPAYCVLGSDGLGHASEGDPLSRALDAVERVTRTQADAMTKLSEQLSSLVEAAAKIVTAADSAGITRRPPRVEEDDDDDDEPAAVAVAPAPVGPSPWEPLVKVMTPLAPQLMEAVLALAMAKFGPKSAAATAAAAAAGTTNGAAGATNGAAPH